MKLCEAAWKSEKCVEWKAENNVGYKAENMLNRKSVGGQLIRLRQ